MGFWSFVVDTPSDRPSEARPFVLPMSKPFGFERIRCLDRFNGWCQMVGTGSSVNYNTVGNRLLSRPVGSALHIFGPVFIYFFLSAGNGGSWRTASQGR